MSFAATAVGSVTGGFGAGCHAVRGDVLEKARHRRPALGDVDTTAGDERRRGALPGAGVHQRAEDQLAVRGVETRTKKADVAEYPQVFDHVGLLFNEPPGTAGLLSI